MQLILLVYILTGEWLIFSIGSPKCKNTPVTPRVQLHIESDSVGVDGTHDRENIPPREACEEPQVDVPSEPTSVGEFRVLLRMEASRLSSAKAAWEDVMTEEGESIPEIGMFWISCDGHYSLFLQQFISSQLLIAFAQLLACAVCYSTRSFHSSLLLLI